MYKAAPELRDMPPRSDDACYNCYKPYGAHYGEACPDGEARPSDEAGALMRVFQDMLQQVTADGQRKRDAGLKPPWWKDTSHRAAIFSHLNRYEHGERVDPDSGAHPLVHLAWRALAIAYQETYGHVDPARRTREGRGTT